MYGQLIAVFVTYHFVAVDSDKCSKRFWFLWNQCLPFVRSQSFVASLFIVFKDIVSNPSDHCPKTMMACYTVRCSWSLYHITSLAWSVFFDIWLSVITFVVDGNGCQPRCSAQKHIFEVFTDHEFLSWVRGSFSCSQSSLKRVCDVMSMMPNESQWIQVSRCKRLYKLSTGFDRISWISCTGDCIALISCTGWTSTWSLLNIFKRWWMWLFKISWNVLLQVSWKYFLS